MWYKIAQQSLLKYTLVMDPNNTIATFTSPTGKDGYPLYPTVNIFFEQDNQIIKFWNKYFKLIETDLKTKEIPEIMQDILDVFVKYPPGVIPKLTRNTTINIVSRITFEIGKTGDSHVDPHSNPAGIYRMGDIYINKDHIIKSLDHEMGHALDIEKNPLKKVFPFRNEVLLPGAKSHSEYGTTNSQEAFAEAFELLAKKGIDYRLDPSEENTRANLILDFVAEKIRSKGIENFKDFGSQIKFDVKDRDNPERKNLYGARLTALVGGLQSAYDKFQGDKSIFLKKLYTDKQTQKDIAAYVSKQNLPFLQHLQQTMKSP